jgi:hypothetical protein
MDSRIFRLGLCLPYTSHTGERGDPDQTGIGFSDEKRASTIFCPGIIGLSSLYSLVTSRVGTQSPVAARLL